MPYALVAQDRLMDHDPDPGPSAAETFPTPYNPGGDYHTCSIKGKVLPFILGNGGGFSTMLGLEYGFAKNQSIGVDAFFEYTGSSDDNVADTAGVVHDFGAYYTGLEKALFLNYRYYFNFQRLREKQGIAPYIVAFLRYGKIDQHYDPLYPLSRWQSNKETQYSTGILIGGTAVVGGKGRLGLDVNFGLFEKEKVISAVYLKNGVETMVNGRPIGIGFRLSVNLSYWFFWRKGR
jgi:hypothetical protein